jgi:hypothetical protein
MNKMLTENQDRWKQPKSENIACLAYDDDTNELYVVFNSSRSKAYIYAATQAEYETILNSAAPTSALKPIKERQTPLTTSLGFEAPAALEPRSPRKKERQPRLVAGLWRLA